MRLGIAGYHRGFELKEKIVAELKALGHEVVTLVPMSLPKE